MDNDLKALAGEFGRAILQRHHDNPAPRPESFAYNEAAPPSKHPWGIREEPWTGHRFLIAKSRRSFLLGPANHVPAHRLGLVVDAAMAFLGPRGRDGVSPASANWRIFCAMAMDAMDEAFAILQRRHRGEAWSVAQFNARFGPSAPPAGWVAALREAVVEPPARVPLRGLIAHWKAYKGKPDPQTAERFAGKLEAFAVFLQHDDAERVTREDFRRWGEALAARRPKLSATTVNNAYAGAVKACFAAAWKAGVLPHNPLAGVGALMRVDADAPPRRRGFNDKEAALILRAARDARPTMRWLTWLMAYSGARIVELSPLQREDVRWATGAEASAPDRCDSIVATPGLTGGVYFLRLYNAGESPGDRRRATPRDVPLHPAVIAEGFLEFIERMPDGSFVFADLPMDRYGRKDSGSKIYNPWLRNAVGIKHRRAHGLSGLSWRLRMEKELRRKAKASIEMTGAILGHAHKVTDATDVTPSLAEKSESLLRVPVVPLQAG